MNPRRGDVWYIDPGPTVGAKKQKQRPVAVLSSDTLEVLPLRIIVPFTGWQQKHEARSWMVRVDADGSNGLKKDSAADASQVRSVAVERLTNKIGQLRQETVDEIAEAVVLCLDL